MCLCVSCWQFAPAASLLNKADLIAKIRYVEAHPDVEIEVEGVLEKLPDGFGFLPSAKYDYVWP